MSGAVAGSGVRLSRMCVVAVLALGVAACGLPRSGPKYSQIDPTDANVTLPFSIVEVDGTITEATQVDERLLMPPSFIEGSASNTSLLGVGDQLSVSVWETADDAVFSGPGQRVQKIDRVQIDRRGHIYLPYVGDMHAAGQTLRKVRAIISSRLQDRALDPQVEVRLIQSTSKYVTIQGAVNSAGVYPIESVSRRLLPMLARAGGVALDPEVAAITVRRGDDVGRVWLQDLYDNPALNIALRPGDTVLLERDRRAFTAMGAFGQQTRVPFPTRNISALDAISTVGGLIDGLADPTGVFVFRQEPADVASLVLNDPSIVEPKRIAYILDMSRPDSMFIGSDFQMRDGDALYVTNAPWSEFRKVLSAISPAVSFAGSVSSLSQ